MKRFVKWMMAAALVLSMGVAGAAETLLGPGDVVKLSVYGSPDLSLETRVSDSGNITFPLLGQVAVGGLSVAAAEKKIGKSLEADVALTVPAEDAFLAEVDGGELAGWAALRRVDPRWCYRGVAEVSIYVGEKFRGRGLGSRLLTALCDESEKEGYWTLHSTVLQDNTASLGLHTKCGFRVVGRRERIARDCHGRWLDTYLMERRAKADEPAGYKKL